MSHMRFIVLTAIVTLALTLSSVRDAHATTQDKSIIGNWKLARILDSADITALDDKQARRLLGTVVRIEHDRLRFGKEVCKNPDFEVTVADTDTYFLREYRAGEEKLGLPNPVTEVSVSCTQVYKKAPDRIVFYWKGFFFDAVRQK